MEPELNSEQPFLTNREMIRDMHTKIDSMYNVVYGDEKAEIPGISKRVAILEKSDKKRTGIYLLISAISSGIALGFKAIIDHLK